MPSDEPFIRVDKVVSLIHCIHFIILHPCIRFTAVTRIAGSADGGGNGMKGKAIKGNLFELSVQMRM